MARRAGIVGLAETVTRDAGGRSALELQAVAVRDALTDAGLGLRDVDAIYALPPYSEAHTMFGLTLAEYLGLVGSVGASVDVGGTVSPVMMVMEAIWAIERGLHGTAVCVFGEAARTGRRYGGTGWTTEAVLGTEEFEEPFGAVGFVIPYAMIAAEYLQQYGGSREGLAAVAVSARRHAALHPAALMRERPMCTSDYYAAPMVSDPLGLLDCSVMADGAGAVVVTGLDRAGDSRHGPVEVLGCGVGVTHKNISQLPALGDLGMRRAARAAYAEAECRPEDVNVALVHDAFTISTLLTVEGLGFCQEGEGSDYALEGHLDLGSRCPVNPHGGLLSQGHVGGMLHVTEAVRQLRGEAGERQVPGAEVAVVAGNGAIFGVCGVLLLGRR